MTIVKSKPTSPGRRFRVKVSNKDLHKGEPYEPLLAKLNKSGGRNNQGRITTRHIGGGHKKRYRIIDFKRVLDGVAGIVNSIEYDPNRSARIALVKSDDGRKFYMIAPDGLKVGEKVTSGENSDIKTGNSLPLKSIPLINLK